MTRVCEHCGEKFETSRMGRPKKFCSDGCRLAAHNARRSGFSSAKQSRNTNLIQLVPTQSSTSKSPKGQPLSALRKEIEDWKQYVLRTWPLDGAERRLLTLACECWETYRTAKEVVDSLGFSIPPARRGGQPKERPEVRIMERARQDFARILGQLNLAHAGDPEGLELEESHA